MQSQDVVPFGLSLECGNTVYCMRPHDWGSAKYWMVWNVVVLELVSRDSEVRSRGEVTVQSQASPGALLSSMRDQVMLVLLCVCSRSRRRCA